MSEVRIKAFVQIIAFSLALIHGLVPSAKAADPVVEKIISTYQANQARFHQQYRGQIFHGEGQVLSISADMLGTGNSFFIGIDFDGSKISCDTTNQNIAASLDKGQPVKISGRINDVVFGALDLNDCSFESPANPHTEIDKALIEKPKINAKCNLTIEGKQAMNGPCYFSSDRDGDSFDDLKLRLKCPNGIITTGAGDGCAGFEITTSVNGVFGSLDRDNGVGQLCWNGGEQRRAQQCYHNLQRKGGCWKNAEVSFCAYKN